MLIVKKTSILFLLNMNHHASYPRYEHPEGKSNNKTLTATSKVMPGGGNIDRRGRSLRPAVFQARSAVPPYNAWGHNIEHRGGEMYF